MGDSLVARWAAHRCFAMRATQLSFLVFFAVAGCGTRVAGEHFRSDYGGKCSAVNSPFAASVSQSGTAVDALRSGLIDALNDRYSALQYCYTEALANEPMTRGRFLLRVLADGQGRIRNVVIPADSTGFPELACCVATLVKGLRLPATGASGRFGFDYPFFFRTVSVPPTDTSVDFSYTGARKDMCEVVISRAAYQWEVYESESANDARPLTEDKYAAPGDPLK